MPMMSLLAAPASAVRRRRQVLATAGTVGTLLMTGYTESASAASATGTASAGATLGGLFRGATLSEAAADEKDWTRGMDVSGHQRNVDWAAAWRRGGRFVYIKATEGTSFRNPYFAQQYNGSYSVGMIRGAYHFALPNRSSGAAQGAYLARHGGQWTSDGRTLPPALDIEYNPYGPTCYGLSPSAMVSWIKDFSDTVEDKVGRHPVIYTTANWWKRCTGNDSSIGDKNPLWIARWSTESGELPAGWEKWRFWQTSNRGSLPGDQNVFGGSLKKLRKFAKDD